MRVQTRFLSLATMAVLSASGVAQTAQPLPKAQHIPALTSESPVVEGACPTVVTAKYIPGAALRPVKPGDVGEARKPLYISFGLLQRPYGEQEPRIAQAQITVRGISEKGGVIPASPAKNTPWLQRTFTVNVAANPAGVQSGTAWLVGYGGVGEVRVDSITYANGRVWKAAAERACRAHTGMVLAGAE